MKRVCIQNQAVPTHRSEVMILKTKKIHKEFSSLFILGENKK